MINTILHTILLKGVRNNTVSGGCSSSEWRDGLEAETFAVKLQKAACIYQFVVTTVIMTIIPEVVIILS